MISATAVIPARLSSTRFPGKPLLPIGETSLIVHLTRSVLQSGLFERVVVTSPDKEILDAVQGLDVVTWHSVGKFRSGSERVFDYVRACGLDTKFVVNIQGDMPAIDVSALRRLLQRMDSMSDLGIGTLARSCMSLTEFNDRNRVKVVLNRDQRAVYFSRLPIPSGADLADALVHIGIYVFNRNVVEHLTGVGRSILAAKEDLEQLDWVFDGISMLTEVVNWTVPSVDDPTDVVELENWLSNLSAKDLGRGDSRT